MFFGMRYIVVILGLLGISWRPNLIPFWYARSGTRVPKIDFLKPLSVFEQFLSLGWSLELVFDSILNDFGMFLVDLLASSEKQSSLLRC